MEKKFQWLCLTLSVLFFSALFTACSSEDELTQEEEIIEPEVNYIFNVNESWDGAPSSVGQPMQEACVLSLAGGGGSVSGEREEFMNQKFYLAEDNESKSLLLGNSVTKDSRKRGQLVTAATFHKTFMLWSTGNVFDKTKMTNITGTQSYKPNKSVVWGNHTEATIYGIAPYSEYAYNSMSVDDAEFTYTTPSVATSQVDLMVSKVQARSTDETINFPFTHALSAIRFKVGDNGIEWATKLVSITISGIYVTGTYSFETGEWTGTKIGSITQTFNEAQDWEIGDMLTDDNKGTTFFVLPQTAPEGAKVHITLVDEVFGEYTLTSNISGKTWTKGHTKAYKVSKVFEYGELFAAGSVPYQFNSAGGTGVVHVCSSRYKQNGGWSQVVGPLKPARWHFEMSLDNYGNASTSLPSWITMEKVGGGGAVWSFTSMDEIGWETFGITVAPYTGSGTRYCQIGLRQPGSGNLIWFCIFQGAGAGTPTTNLKDCVNFISGLRNECLGNGNIMLGTDNVIYDGYNCIINGNNNAIGYTLNNMSPPQYQYDNYYTYINGYYNDALGSYAGINGNHNFAWGNYSICGSRPSGNWYINPWPAN